MRISPPPALLSVSDTSAMRRVRRLRAERQSVVHTSVVWPIWRWMGACSRARKRCATSRERSAVPAGVSRWCRRWCGLVCRVLPSKTTDLLQQRKGLLVRLSAAACHVTEDIRPALACRARCTRATCRSYRLLGDARILCFCALGPGHLAKHYSAHAFCRSREHADVVVVSIYVNPTQVLS